MPASDLERFSVISGWLRKANVLETVDASGRAYIEHQYETTIDRVIEYIISALWCSLVAEVVFPLVLKNKKLLITPQWLTKEGRLVLNI